MLYFDENDVRIPTSLYILTNAKILRIAWDKQQTPLVVCVAVLNSKQIITNML